MKDLKKVIVTTSTRLSQIVLFSAVGDVETNPGPDNANMNWKEKLSAKYYSEEAVSYTHLTLPTKRIV